MKILGRVQSAPKIHFIREWQTFNTEWKVSELRLLKSSAHKHPWRFLPLTAAKSRFAPNAALNEILIHRPANWIQWWLKNLHNASQLFFEHFDSKTLIASNFSSETVTGFLESLKLRSAFGSLSPRKLQRHKSTPVAQVEQWLSCKLNHPGRTWYIQRAVRSCRAACIYAEYKGPSVGAGRLVQTRGTNQIITLWITNLGQHTNFAHGIFLFLRLL